MKRSALTIFDRTSEPDPPEKTPESPPQNDNNDTKTEPAEQNADARLASWYAPGMSDGLGDRLLMFDNSGAPTLELLRFKAEFSRSSGFEAALRHRVEQLARLSHPAIAKVRDVKWLGSGDGLALVSHHVEGRRLSEILEEARGAGFARELIRQITPALAALQRQGHDIAHGALSPERIVVTPDGRLVITEHVVGGAIESMNWSSERLGAILNLVPTPGEQAQRSDVVQLGAMALSLLQGKRVDPADCGRDAGSILEAAERAHADNPAAAADLIEWIKRALQIGDRKFATAIEAHEALAELPAERAVPVLEAHARHAGEVVEFPRTEPEPVAPPMPVAPSVPVRPAGRVAPVEPPPAPQPSSPQVPRFSDPRGPKLVEVESFSRSRSILDQPVWRSQYEPPEPPRPVESDVDEAADAVAPRRFAGLRAFFGRRVDVAAWALNVIGVLFGVQLVIIAALVFSRPADQFAFQIDGVSAGTEVIVDGRSVGTSADPAVRLHLATSTQSVQVKVPPAPAGLGRATGAKSTAPRPVATSTLAPPPVQSANGVTTMTPAQPAALQQGFVSRAWHFSTDWIGALYRRVKYSLQN